MPRVINGLGLFGQTPRVIIEDKNLSDAGVRLYTYLACRGIKRECFPSINTIAENLGWSESKVHRTMTELTLAQYVVIKYRNGQSSEYLVCWPENPEPEDIRQDATKSAPEPAAVAEQGGVIPGTHKNTTNITTNSLGINPDGFIPTETEVSVETDQKIWADEKPSKTSRNLHSDKPVEKWGTGALSNYFELTVASKPTFPQVVNHPALRKTFRTWLNTTSPPMIKAMIDVFAADYDRMTKPGDILWKAFIYRAPQLWERAKRMLDEQIASENSTNLDYLLGVGEFDTSPKIENFDQYYGLGKYA